jgi:hypothetical protein
MNYQKKQGKSILASIAASIICCAFLIPRNGFSQIQWSISHPSSTDSGLYRFLSISCSDENNCTAVGYKNQGGGWYSVIAVRTTDGGVTWTDQYVSLPLQFTDAEKKLRHVQQVNAMNIVAAGDSGLVVRTTDGGITWHRQDMEPQTNIRGVSFTDSADGMIFGGGGFVSITTDAGNSWEKVSGLPIWLLTAGRMYSKEEIILVHYGFGQLLYTHDGWKTWDTSAMPAPYSPQDFHHVANACFLDDRGVYLYGYHVDSSDLNNIYKKYVFFSSNEGKNWLTVLDSNSGISSDVQVIISLDVTQNGFIFGGGYTNWIPYRQKDGRPWEIDSIYLDISIAQIPSIAMLNNSSALMVAQNIGYGNIIKADFSKLSVVSSGASSYEALYYGTQIYPNPANNSFIISTYLDDVTQYQIYDVLGRTVRLIEPKGTRELTIASDDLAPGVYKLCMRWHNKNVPLKQIVIIH